MVPVLAVQGVRTGYDKTVVIDDVSFAVEPGEFLGIIGPNGAGKSTVFKALSRVLPLWQGSVTWRGKDIRSLGRRELARHMAAIPQFLMPFPFSVEEYVRMGRYPHRGRFAPFTSDERRIVREVLQLMDLTALGHKRINTLSGGELQRVCLAQALAQQPELLLMDEPTAHLDIGNQVRIMDIVKGLTRTRGLSAVIILHDLNLASVYCDTLALMHAGRMHCRGRPEEVLKREHIEAVYHVRVDVRPDPVTLRPHMFLRSSEL
jgi:iron complex transport system ATP-binding protein